MTTDTRTDRAVELPSRAHPEVGPAGGSAPGAVPSPASRLDRAAPDAVPADAGLRRRYATYRRRQGAALLSLLPRAGVRSIYGAALSDGAVRGAPDPVPEGDTVGALADYCADRLPLPPFEVWREDFRSNPAAHLEADEGYGTSGPVTVALRSFDDASGRAWYAALDLWRDPAAGAFRGSIAFHDGDGGRHFTTAEVFREDTADGVRTRFADFDDVTLRAFLRSVLP